MNKLLKIILISLVIYSLYKHKDKIIRYHKLLNDNYNLLLGASVVYLIYTFVFEKNLEEGFALDANVITDKTRLQAGTYYQVGTLSPDSSSTINSSLNKGADCPQFPQTIYIPVSPVDATCLSGLDLYNFASETTIGTCDTNNMKKGTLKSIETLFSSGGITKTSALYGGKTCTQQATSGLIVGYSGANVSTRCLNALCLSGDALYTFPAETREVCSTTNTKTGALKSLDSLTTAGGITIVPALSGGLSCSTQIGTISSTKTLPCTTPIPADCIGGVTASDPTVATVVSNANTNSNYIIDPTPYSASFWTTGIPTADDRIIALNASNNSLAAAQTASTNMNTLLNNFNSIASDLAALSLSKSAYSASGTTLYNDAIASGSTTTTATMVRERRYDVWNFMVNTNRNNFNTYTSTSSSTLYQQSDFIRDRDNNIPQYLLIAQNAAKVNTSIPSTNVSTINNILSSIPTLQSQISTAANNAKLNTGLSGVTFPLRTTTYPLGWPQTTINNPLF